MGRTGSLVPAEAWRSAHGHFARSADAAPARVVNSRNVRRHVTPLSDPSPCQATIVVSVCQSSAILNSHDEVAVATLLRKKDGSWYIRGRAGGGFCTWQVSRAGVAELQRRNCGPGDELHPSLVGWLAHRDLIYTGGGGVDETPGIPQSPSSVWSPGEPATSSRWWIVVIIIILLALIGSLTNGM
jgi:hypothetical protein